MTSIVAFHIPRTMGFIFVLRFHILCISIWKFLNLMFFSAAFLLYYLVMWAVTSIVVFCSLCPACFPGNLSMYRCISTQIRYFLWWLEQCLLLFFTFVQFLLRDFGIWETFLLLFSQYLCLLVLPHLSTASLSLLSSGLLVRPLYSFLRSHCLSVFIGWSYTIVILPSTDWMIFSGTWLYHFVSVMFHP